VTRETLKAPQEDGLPHQEVGTWTEDKHNLVFLYDSLFSTGMKNKWDARIYIDLFSGPGIVRVKGTNKFFWGSPLLALQVKDAFDKYIFCESVPAYIDALKRRSSAISPQADISFVDGDCNLNVD
jgi:three-Cys-motif partner protein